MTADDHFNFDELEINIDDPVEVIAKSKQLAVKVRPEWNLAELSDKLFSDGITNVLVGIFQEGGNKKDMVLVRVYGHNTAELIDRRAEIDNMLLFQRSGCGSKLYATFKNGMAYSYIPGVIPTSEMVADPAVYKLIVREFAKMHKMKMGGKPGMWDMLRKVYSVYCQTLGSSKRTLQGEVPSGENIVLEIEELERVLGNCDSPVVFCHNDLLLGNIVYDKDSDKVNFIDYEYGGMNYQAFDIANHFCEFVGVIGELDYDKLYPNEDFQKAWIAMYLREFHGESKVTEDEVHKTYVLVQRFSLCAHLFWGIWTLVQALNSSLDFDFAFFGKQRFDEYKRRKEQFLALQ